MASAFKSNLEEQRDCSIIKICTSKSIVFFSLTVISMTCRFDLLPFQSNVVSPVAYRCAIALFWRSQIL